MTDDGQVEKLTTKKPKMETATERRVINGIPVYALEELVEDMRRLGPENESEMVDWGPDRGSEIIEDEYSRGEITLEDLLRRNVS